MGVGCGVECGDCGIAWFWGDCCGCVTGDAFVGGVGVLFPFIIGGLGEFTSDGSDCGGGRGDM